jgi:cell division topological specificity factor
MSIFNYLKKRNATANVAKERLQIIISHERSQRNTPDYIPKLQEEILEVLAKYVPINKQKVSVNVERIGNGSVLELNVTMPDQTIAESIEND